MASCLKILGVPLSMRTQELRRTFAAIESVLGRSPRKYT
jgi:hypothetical protein